MRSARPSGISTKLLLPAQPGHVIDRPRLVPPTLGAEGAELPALWTIVAPPGYGKTVAAVQMAAALDKPSCWVALDPLDDDPARFVHSILLALEPLLGDLHHVRERVGSDRIGIELALRALGEVLAANADPLVLVLDDFQVVTNRDILEAVAQWLRNPTANLTIICVSRSDVPLPLGRLRSQAKLVETTAAELTFTGFEAQRVVSEAFGIDLDERCLELLIERTKGWPVAVYLAGLSLCNSSGLALEPGSSEPKSWEQVLRGFTGASPHVSEYLSHEVLAVLDPPVREFLLFTCVAEVLSASHCDALVGGIGSESILRGLLTQPVYIEPLDDPAEGFRLHPLFRDYLRSVLVAEHPDLVSGLYLRSSRWHEASGGIQDMEKAIRQAGKAGDPERLRDLVAATWFVLGQANCFDVIEEWVEQVDRVGSPPAGMALGAYMAYAEVVNGRTRHAERWLERSRSDALPGETELLTATELIVRAQLRRAEGDALAMRSFARRAIEATRPGVERGDVTLVAMHGEALSLAGEAEHILCEDREAKRLLIAATSVGGSGAATLVRAHGHLALLAAERGDGDTAEHHIARALAAATGYRCHLTTVYLARSLVESQRSLLRAALASAEQAMGCLPLDSQCDDRAFAQLHRSRLLHQLGQVDAARRSLRSARRIAQEFSQPRLEVMIRRVENETRFVRFDVDSLPVGARELTRRERGVLALLPSPLSRAEVARELGVSENTIKTHLTSISHKLGVRGRSKLVARARELALL